MLKMYSAIAWGVGKSKVRVGGRSAAKRADSVLRSSCAR